MNSHIETPEATGPLLTAALSGLLCLGGAGCNPSPEDVQACDSAVDPDSAVVTSTETDTTMTLQEFTLECLAMGGTLETHSHCGGENSCQGLSYNSGTQTLTHNTCAGLNTCTGYSCVVCSDTGS